MVEWNSDEVILNWQNKCSFFYLVWNLSPYSTTAQNTEKNWRRNEKIRFLFENNMQFYFLFDELTPFVQVKFADWRTYLIKPVRSAQTKPSQKSV